MGPLRQRLGAALGGLPTAFWALWAGMLVNRLGGFVVVFLGLYLVRERGFTAAEAGRVAALYGLGVVAAGPVGGALADRIGRRATMILGLVSGATSVCALAFTREPVALAVLAFLAAGTGELYRPAMNAAVADLVPPPDRARAFGLVYWAVNLGWSIGLTIAGLVANRSLVALFVADAVTTFAFAFVVWLRVPETRPAAPREAPRATPRSGLIAVARDGHLMIFLGLHAVALIVFTQFQLAAPIDLAAHGVGPSTFAYLLAMNGVGVVVLQPLLGVSLRDREAGHVLAASSLLFGLGFGLNAFAGSVPVYAAGVLLWTVGEVIGFPVASTLVANLSPTALRGRYQGAFSMTWGLAFTVSPLFGGELLARLGSRALWLACLALGLAVALGHLAAAGPRRRHLRTLHGAATPETAAPQP